MSGLAATPLTVPNGEDLPEGWRRASLVELGGKVTSGSRGWATFYSDYGDLFVRITNLRRSDIHLDLSNCRFVKLPTDASEAKRTKLLPGDLLVSITADIGIIGYVDDAIPSPAYINQHIARVRFDPRRVSSKFIAYYLSSWEPQRTFVGMTDTGAKAGMNLTMVGALETIVPPFGEQVRIAETLSAVDRQIKYIERVIAKRTEVRLGMAQQLLTGNIRLPGFSDAWERKPLAEVVSIRSGTPKPRARQGGGRYWLVDMGSVTRDGRFVVTKRTDSGNDVLRADELVMPKDDIGGGNIIGRAGRIDKDDTYVLADHVYALTPARDDSRYLTYAINSYVVNTSLRAQATGSAQLGLSKRSVQRQEVLIPSLPEQRAIADALTNADAELDLLHERLEKAYAMRQGVRQGLLTGRTRVPSMEAVA